MNSLFLKMNLCFILVALNASIAFAGISQEVTVEGYVYALNGEQVTLLVGNKKIDVNIKDIPSYYNLNSGQKVVAIIKRKIDKKNK